MSEESRLQLRSKDNEFALALSKGVQALAARGLRDATALEGVDARGRVDATLLSLHAEAESEEHRSGGIAFLREPWVDLLNVETVQRDAEKGDARCQVVVAFRYMIGNRDLNETVHWVRKAADQGYPPAWFLLAWMYDNPCLGVPDVGQDLNEAASWYRKAAEQGYAPAQFNLGVMYDMGEGVTLDHTEATKWYRNAAHQGLNEAQFNLGLKYDHGQGVPRNPGAAAMWYGYAALDGSARAQFNLGLKYATGDGVKQQSLVFAYVWVSLAAPRANEAGGKRYLGVRDRVAARMSPAEVADAQRLASDWEQWRASQEV